MSKIIQVMNSMILNSDKITNVRRSLSKKEYFFLYDNKYAWSLMELEVGKDYSLYFYPNQKDAISLSRFTSFDDIDVIAYNSSEFNYQEAIETFKILFTILSEKLYDMDIVFSDILKDM